jgi:hypothetical protein
MKTIPNLRGSSLRLNLVALILLTLPIAAPDGTAAGATGSPPAVDDVVRIVAGLWEPLTDEMGGKWLPASGFAGGDTMDRPGLKIENTRIPSVYCSERFGMTRFVREVSNGKYTVKLHFAITYEGIDGPSQCVFSYDVEGVAINDFDLYVKAGGVRKAYVETVPVEVRDGELTITFASQSGNPAISAIEIIRRP